jgi:hypothetical protein
MPARQEGKKCPVAARATKALFLQRKSKRPEGARSLPRFIWEHLLKIIIK